MEQLRPFEQFAQDPRSRECLQSIAVVATDVDGTLTTAGKLGVEVLEGLRDLAASGIRVLPVSGRCAGEVLGLVRYLPGVQQGIAENGLLVLEADRPPLRLLPDADQRRLREAGDRLNLDHDAKLRLAPDEMFRLCDIAYERDGRDEVELERLRTAASAIGVHLIWSSVHVHLSPVPPDKGRAVLEWAQQSGVAPERILTIGDAPNDIGLFVPDRFGLTVGTADVVAQRAHFDHLPRVVTSAREAFGFLEMSRALVAVR